MIIKDLSYEAQLQNYCLAYELIKRKLRSSYVSQLLNNISLPEIRDIHRAIHHGDSPKSGLLPAIDAIPQTRESLLYLSLFASLYRSASQVDIRTKMDVPAIILLGIFFVIPFQIRSVNAGLMAKCALPISAKHGLFLKL